MSTRNFLNRSRRSFRWALLYGAALLTPVLLTSNFLWRQIPVSAARSSTPRAPNSAAAGTTTSHPASAVDNPSDTVGSIANTTERRPVINWRGTVADHRWSNPANWEGGHVPGASDVARFTAHSKSDASVDRNSVGMIAGLELDEGYRGSITLKRDLSVTGDLLIAGGSFNQGDYSLSARHYSQSSGTFTGGAAKLAIEGEAAVSGGTLTTPRLMRADSLVIQSPAIVRMAANSKLELSGTGEPLRGSGVLDTTTNQPNSLEYTGQASADLTAAPPVRGLTGIGSISRSQMMSGLQNPQGQESSRPISPEGFGRIGALTLSGANELFSAVIDPAGGFAYFGTNTSPGVVVKVRLSDFTRVGALTLNSEDGFPRSAVIDPAGGFAYFGNENFPSNVIKVRLSDFTRVGALTLNSGEDILVSAVIDPAGGFAYFGNQTNRVVKVRLSDFTRAGALLLNSGEDYLGSAVIDAAGGFAYFGTDTSPGKVVKVRLSDFTRVGALTLNSGDDFPLSAVIDPAGGFAYFGAFTSPGNVVKVQLSDFTRVSALTLNSGEYYLNSAVIDPAGGFAYFGTGAPVLPSPPSKVVKVRLSDFTRVGALTLNSGEYGLLSAVIDPVGGFAYFGTESLPGIVVKIDISAAAATPTPTPTPTPNTPSGSNVTVQTSDASVTFPTVSQTGTTTFMPINPASAGAPPSGYTLCPSCPAYDITTNASYAPPVTVCLTVPASIDQQTFATLSLLHREGGVLLDRTTNRITNPDGTRKVCGSVSSLSPFALAQGPAATPTPTPTPTATPTPTPKTIQFSAANYNVGEGDGHVDTLVTRSGDTTAAATVSFSTSDQAAAQNCNVKNGLASSRCDYEARFATVKFAPGETSKTISIFIIDDSYLEGPETFQVNLSNPTGATLGTQATATVTIIDNDIADGPNPIDNSRFFVKLHYLDFFNREPDQSGWDFWTNNINNCTPQPSCIEPQRINTSAAYFLSIEFQQTGYLVERTYKAAYGDASGTSTIGGTHSLAVPIVRLNEFLFDTQQIGQGVVVLQSGWEMVLENNKQAFTLDFVQRSRFTTAFPTTMTPMQFVNQLFTNAGVTPSSTDRNAAIAEFGSAANTSDLAARSRALRDVAENSLLQQQEFNRAFVLMQFYGYLRRNPNDPQDTDYSGYEFWLNKLNFFNGNYNQAEMVKAFITSIEYRQRFGP